MDWPKEVQDWLTANAADLSGIPDDLAVTSLCGLAGKALRIEANRLRRGTRHLDRHGVRPRGPRKPFKSY